MTGKSFFVGLAAVVLGLTFALYPVCTTNDGINDTQTAVAEIGGRAPFLDWQDDIDIADITTAEAGVVQLVCIDDAGCPVYSDPPPDELDSDDSDAN